MIFNKDLLFLHVPKTGGISVSRYLLEVLPRPVYYSHKEHDPELEKSGVTQINGVRHETLAEAIPVLERYGFRIEDFKVILAALRNPYEMEVSRYAYLQAGHPWDAGFNANLAQSGNFEDFAMRSVDHGGEQRPIHAYFQLNGKIPPQLRIIRTEYLTDELKKALALIGLSGGVELVHANRSKHAGYSAYYTRAAEQATYERYRWAFDTGNYPRMDTGSLPEEPPLVGVAVPVTGPFRQVGEAKGLWDDAWVGDRFVVRGKLPDRISHITIRGQLPSAHRQPVTFTVSLDEAVTEHVVDPEKGRLGFTLQIPCDKHAGSRICLTIKASATFRPRDTGLSKDARSLSWRLFEVRFRWSLRSRRGVWNRLKAILASLFDSPACLPDRNGACRIQ